MKFDIEKFKKLITFETPINTIEYFEEIDSTNTYLLKRKTELNKTLVIADYQTAGRGRFNRQWLSNPAENLMFSIGLDNIHHDTLHKFSFITPLAVFDGIQNLFDLKVKIKWPNDLIYDRKKLCGILIESSIESQDKAKVVIGVGINVNQISFPDEIKDRSTSLKLILNSEIDREQLLSKIIQSFSELIKIMISDFDFIYNRYKSNCIGIGENISIKNIDQIFHGKFLDITSKGELILLTENEQLTFHSGEITLLKD